MNISRRKICIIFQFAWARVVNNSLFDHSLYVSIKFFIGFLKNHNIKTNGGAKTSTLRINSKMGEPKSNSLNN